MRLLIQRALSGSVTINDERTNSINHGYVVFIGIEDADTKETVERMTKKLLALRIFEDENGKINKSLMDVNGALLLVSQFTLYADASHGNRPSFTNAGEPAYANELYDYMVALCKQSVPIVETGEFGADMKVTLINDGPFTIWLDSREILH